jgi:hypothetical protein
MLNKIGMGSFIFLLGLFFFLNSIFLKDSPLLAYLGIGDHYTTLISFLFLCQAKMNPSLFIFSEKAKIFAKNSFGKSLSCYFIGVH